MKKIIIFGATGTIGAYLSLHLKNLGFNVISVGRRSSDNGFFKENGIKYYSSDITKRSSLSVIPNNIDCIIHLAGNMPSAMKGYKPHKYVNSVLLGTLNVLEYARSSTCKKIVFSHTRADSIDYFGSLEALSPDIYKKFPLKGDHSVYTICKNAAVDLIEHYYHQFGIKRFVLRLPTIYAYHPDPYYFVDGKKRWIGYRLLIDKAMKGEQIEIWGDPSKTKEIVYIKDLLQIIERSVIADSEGGIYNVGRGVGVTLEEQIQGIVSIFSTCKSSSTIVYRPEKPSGRQFVHNIDKTINELGYTPNFDYLAGLRDFKLEMQLNRFNKLWGNTHY